MFTIGFDISGLDSGFKAHAHRGIGRYIRELKRHMGDLPQDGPVRVSFFDYRGVRESGSLPLRLAAKGVSMLPMGRTTLGQQLLYPLQLKAYKCDSFHFPAHMDPPAWGMKKYAVTVLDLIPLVCAEMYKANRSGLRFHFARWLEIQAIKNASLVLAISENTASDVNRILHVPREKIVVTPLGVNEKFFAANRPADPLALRRRYGVPDRGTVILYVGGIDPRKNYSTMLRSFKSVLEQAKEKGQERPILLLAGQIAADREYPKLLKLLKDLEIEESVIRPGFIPEEDLLQLYSISSAFFFPSFYEGFGLPPLEAMAAGLPVVSSNTSSMPEVIGDAALMFDPTDEKAGAAALSQILTNPGLAETLKRAGQARAKLFTWQNTALKTWEAYRKLAGL